ncbi:TolC family protein [Alcanivorax xiamenensis]|uniref:TolC family protein n=1 Tax=Alcanivorax xiamenensis TaxID=1177156 RepID=UPI001358F6C4|nr:TolC family protein [Alcanivorax xiamenensis]
MPILSARATGVACLAVLLAAPAAADTSTWARWVSREMADLPASRAIEAGLQRDRAETRAQAQPLYNPELNVGYENSAETTRTVGLGQTLDWSGKARSGARLGEARAQLAQIRADKARARLSVEVLSALAAYDAAQARLRGVREQEQRLSDLLALVRKRERAGDLGQVDAQLSYLALSRTQQALADAESDATATTTRLRAVLDKAAPDYPLPAADRWAPSGTLVMDAVRAEQSYDLRLARLQVMVAERQVELARKQRRTDPSFGVTFGREGEDNLWGLDFSLPLPLFNTGKAEYQAALADGDARRALLAQQQRAMSAGVEGALSDYQQRRDRWRTWRDLSGNRLADAADLLHRTWQLGEITTQDYLQGLNQRQDALLAGIALRESMQKAWLEWLYQSAQLDSWIETLAAGNRGQGGQS